jgi:hypothetical protein
MGRTLQKLAKNSSVNRPAAIRNRYLLSPLPSRGELVSITGRFCKSSCRRHAFLPAPGVVCGTVRFLVKAPWTFADNMMPHGAAGIPKEKECRTRRILGIGRLGRARRPTRFADGRRRRTALRIEEVGRWQPDAGAGQECRERPSAKGGIAARIVTGAPAFLAMPPRPAEREQQGGANQRWKREPCCSWMMRKACCPP